jgi:hypothetical protein
MSSVGDGTTTRGLTGRWAPTGTNQATRTLLLCVAAGPIYVVVGGLQASYETATTSPATRSAS